MHLFYGDVQLLGNKFSALVREARLDFLSYLTTNYLHFNQSDVVVYSSPRNLGMCQAELLRTT